MKFGLGQKECDNLWKCDFLRCDYHEWRHNLFSDIQKLLDFLVKASDTEKVGFSKYL